MKLPFQPILGVKNEPITKNGVLTLIALFFWKFNLDTRTSYKPKFMYQLPNYLN